MTQTETSSMANGNEEIWRVQLATGEVRAMTLDELDGAFDAGHLSAHTPVLAPGSTAWSQLGIVAGLEDEAPSQAAPSSLAPFAIPTDVASMAPSGGPSLDLAVDDEHAFSPKKGRVVGALVGGLVMLTLVGVGLTKVVASQDLGKAAAAGAVIAHAAPETKVEKTDDEANTGNKLSADQKQKLIDADKAREAKAKAKVAPAAPGRVQQGPRKKEANPFHNGGDKYDPLNGQL